MVTTTEILHDDVEPAPARSKRMSLHLLQHIDPTFAGLSECPNPRYAEKHGFTIEEVTVGEVPALLYSGVIDSGRPPAWASTVAGLTGVRPPGTNRTAAAVLLIPVDGEVFALTYGMGHLLLAPGTTTPGFGLSFALRALVPDAVRQVTHTAMDARGRTDRNSVSLDQSIASFGIEPYGEIVSRLAGKPKEIALTFSRGRSRSAQITGTDSLRIHLGVHPEDLLADLAEILRIYRESSEASEFGFIAKVRPLKPSDTRRTQLDAILDSMLGANSPDDRIALTVPAVHLDGEDAANAYALKVGPGPRLVVRDLSLDVVRGAVASVQAGQRLPSLAKGTIQAYSDERATEAASGAIAAHKWIAAEANIGTSRFFHHEGRWFEIGDQHREILQQQVDEIVNLPAGIMLPDWTPDLKDEAAYNEAVAATLPGYVCLDRDLLYTKQHPRGIEACDLLGPEDELIHVKRASSTAPLNHLFQQGRASIEALRWDPEAREKFIAKVRMADPTRSISDDFIPGKVVYAISLSKGKPVTSSSLFTFAQVSLLQAAVALRNTGIEVAVANIDTVG